ncbi:MAG: ABC-F family ATP-binding cassette domain-containing protein [Phycisphaerae bacterium]|nr:ABC-F family ATP-binding cassette domain-containing protein [Phycisphaerae bacterium]
MSFGPQAIFDRLNLKIYPAEKVGLIGSNGCGKTSLLKMILGILPPDTGHVQQRKALRIGYLPQEPVFSGEKTVLEELHDSAQEILDLQKKLHDSAETLSKLHGGELKSAMKQYDRLSSEFEITGGYRYETKIKEIAAGLGLEEKHYPLKTTQLSGGQLSRLGLAKVLLADANLLLLDEPTNHLDWNATLWLEKFLKNYSGAALIVSHDRFLLDRLVCKIVEIRDRGAIVYSGNYSTYRQEKGKRDLELGRQYEQRVEFIEKTRDFIVRNINRKGTKKVAQGRQTRLDNLLKANPDFLEKPKHTRELSFKFAEVENRGKRVDAAVICKNLTKSFDGLTLFENLSFEILTGQRTGIIGPNGRGKTTLLKLARGQREPTSGTIAIKKSLYIGYLDQAGAELNPENTVLEEAASVIPEMLPEQMRKRLGAFLFVKDNVFKKVADLSGGERNRLALCKLVLSEPEVLILDEPTNHLDIPSIEALENALQNYAGTIIVISHDRFFLDRVVQRLIVLGADELGKMTPGRFEFITGSFSRYAELLEQRALERVTGPQAAKPKSPKQDKPRKTTPPELKQFNPWSVEKIEQAIEQTEAKIKELHESFGNEKVYKDYKLLAQVQDQVKEKEQYLELLYRAYELKTSNR